MTQYASKGVIVTGASRGIGRAVATRLARDGFAVTVNYAGNATKAEEVVTEIKVAGGQAIAVQADVANAADVQRLFKEAVDAFDRINVVVNCAGIMSYSPIDRGDMDVFDKVITTNLRGTFVYWQKRLDSSHQVDELLLSQVVSSPWHYQHMVPILLPRQALRDWYAFLPMNCGVAISL